MPIDNPPHLLGRTTPLCAEDEALVSGNSILTSKSAMDMVSVQRPDKLSACPRCQSLDTKFCYFNNYNVKQPRHFCRKCQRYWTAGGALRNVPVGAGRRKHKTPLNSTATKLHPEDNNLVLTQFGPLPGIASGMCYPSKSVNFLPPSHMDGTRPHSFQCVAPMSINAHDHHSGLNACKGIREAMVNKPATESRFLHDAQSDIQQKEEGLSSLRHHGAYYGVEKGIAHVQHWDETSSTEVLPGLYDEKVEDRVPPPSSPPLPSHTSMEEKMEVESSASTCPASDKKIAHPLIWLEQFAKANASVTSESIALQGAYGYGNASLAWSHPLMWPWLLPYASNHGPTCSNMDQAAVSAAWASAVTATAANILQTSHLWNPYGWGRDVNKSEGISLLGKRERSSLHEQEPLCVPKTLKIGHPEEAMHNSILMTLGLSSLSTSSPASVTGFFNADFQPKADLLQHKPTVQLLQQHRDQQRSHANPVAQARSLAFQESN